MASSAVLGTRVQVNGLLGTVRFVGQTEFAAGTWAGVELDEPRGRGDGVFGAKRYFQAKPDCALFARVSQLRGVDGTGDAGSSALTPPPCVAQAVAHDPCGLGANHCDGVLQL